MIRWIWKKPYLLMRFSDQNFSEFLVPFPYAKKYTQKSEKSRKKEDLEFPVQGQLGAGVEPSQERLDNI